ncbi:hypothetical protein LRP88_09542 [Fusarium phalaenopsidis]
MSLNLIRGNPFRGEQTPERGVLTSDGPRHALHLKSSLSIAGLVLTDPTLQVLEEFTLSRARATLVLAIESERFGGSVLDKQIV